MKSMLIAVSSLLLVAMSRQSLGQVSSETDSQHDAVIQLRNKQLTELENKTSKAKIDELAEEMTATLALLTKLDKAASDFSTRFDSLMTDDNGRRIALADGAFLSIIDLQKHPVVTKEAIAAKSKATADIGLTLAADQNDANYGTIPKQSTIDAIRDTKSWASERLADINTLNDEFDVWVARGPHDKDLKALPTLKEQIVAYQLDQVESLNRSRLRADKNAQPGIEKNAEAAEHDRVTLQAQEDSERLLKETKEELERLKIESEMREAKAMDEEKAREGVLKKQLAESEAARTVAAAQNQVTLERAAQDAELTKKRQQCHDPAVTALIQPFTYKGYFQPKSGRGIDAKPMSLAEIRAVGAMTPTAHGLEQLIKCANWSARGALAKDDRPGWGNYLSLQQASNEDVEMVKKAQATLIDLGDALVAEGMLSP